MTERTLLILGLGNPLCADDGLGIAAIEEISRWFDIPEDVRVVDGGTLGLALMPVFEEATHVLMVDAIRDGDKPPGTFVRLTGDEVAPAVRERLSVHQIGVADLLDGLRLIGRYPPELFLVGLVPESVELCTGPSERIRDALPDLVERVVLEAAALGFPLRRRTDVEAAAALPSGLPDFGWSVGLS